MKEELTVKDIEEATRIAAEMEKAIMELSERYNAAANAKQKDVLVPMRALQLVMLSCYDKHGLNEFLYRPNAN